MASGTDLASTIRTWATVSLGLIAIFGIVTPVLFIRRGRSEHNIVLNRIDDNDHDLVRTYFRLPGLPRLKPSINALDLESLLGLINVTHINQIGRRFLESLAPFVTVQLFFLRTQSKVLDSCISSRATKTQGDHIGQMISLSAFSSGCRWAVSDSPMDVFLMFTDRLKQKDELNLLKQSHFSLPYIFNSVLKRKFSQR